MAVATGQMRGGYVVEGPPASGKTVLTKRLIVEAVKRSETPILIPLVRLAALAEKAGREAKRAGQQPPSALDAYLQSVDAATAQAIVCRRCPLIFDGLANPRNPRHFNIVEGGRMRVSTTFMDKDCVSCA